MAGKAGALHGTFQTAHPFDLRKCRAQIILESIAKAGYNYYGSEPMYSGVNGTELHCHILSVWCTIKASSMVSDSLGRSMGP